MAPTLPNSPMPKSAAEQVERLVDQAVAELDHVTGHVPGSRPPHLVQLNGVLVEAAQEARQLETGSSAVTRDSDIWRLREPGYLRAICEHPVDRPGSTLPLVPVVLTWAILGYAEWSYVRDFTAKGTASAPSFFADWVAQPVWRGPVALSAAIVVTVLLIMWRHRRPARAQRRADDVDRLVHRLEADLLAPLAVLRGRLAPAHVEEHTRQASVELAAAARNFTTATGRLNASTAVVDTLVASVDKLVAALPTLGDEAAKLDGVRRGFDHTAQAITTQLEPLATLVTDVTAAAAAAGQAVEGSARALRGSADQLAEATALTARHTAHEEALSAAQRPFAAVADVVAEATGRLDNTAAALQQTVTELRKTIDEVNWLAMVSDGLRHADEQHDAVDGP